MALAAPGTEIDTRRERRLAAAPPAAVCRFLVAAILGSGVGFLAAPRPAAADDDTVAEDRPSHWCAPPGGGGPLVAYDLATECAENARRRDAGQPHSFSCFLLRDYMAAHHPDTAYTWQRPANRAFGFVGTRRPDGPMRQEVYVRWQSLSDGLQWGFSEIEITRHAGRDPFAIVTDTAVRSRIRRAVGADVAGWSGDVFAERTRDVVTDQRNDGLAFEPAGFSTERYGVHAEGGTRFFTLSGEPLEPPAVPGGP